MGSTGTNDQKENLLIPARAGSMDGKWPDSREGLPQFEDRTRSFTAKCHALSLRVVGLWKRGLAWSQVHSLKLTRFGLQMASVCSVCCITHRSATHWITQTMFGGVGRTQTLQHSRCCSSAQVRRDSSVPPIHFRTAMTA